MPLTFFVPPGIGDFSAMYSKLVHVQREMVIRSSNDSPNRMHPFLDILPKIRDGGYAAHGANASVDQTLPPGTDLNTLDDGEYFLAINSWLENGGKVHDWLPGPTDYHYYMDTGEYRQRIQVFLKENSIDEHSPVVGVYCSAYGNARHWNFWTYEKWREFLERIVAKLPASTHYIFVGAEYDVQIAETLHAWMESVGIHSSLTLGAFHIGETIELMKKFDYFFVFPSGLGFLADVVDTPNTMWFPRHLSKMIGTFCDPKNFKSHQTYHGIFGEPQETFLQFCNEGGLEELEKRWKLKLNSKK